MNRTFSILAALVLWLFTAAALRAQESPLELIPQDTLGFAVIHDLSDTNERVAKVTQKMQIPIGDLLTMAKGFLGVQEGLDEKGGLAIALVSGPQGREWEESVWCAVVPVTDYNEFLTPLEPKDPDAKITAVTIMGMNMLAARKGNFAVLASGDTSETLERILTAKASVTAEVKPLAGWMADKHLAVVVTPAGKKLLLQSIVGALPDVEQLKKDAGDPAPEQLGAFENVGEIFGLLKNVLAGADEQLTHLALGLRIEDDASLRLAARVLFTQGGKLAAWSKEVKAPQESLLTGVPAGKFTLAYGGVSAQFSEEMWGLIGQLGEMGMQVIGLDEKDRKRSMEITQKLQAGKQFTSGAMGIMRPGDSLFSTAVSIEHVKNADDQLKISREMFELMAKAKQDGKPLYELHDVKVGDVEAMELVMSLESIAGLGAAAKNAGQAEAQVQGLLGKLFGAEGKIHQYVAKAGSRAIVTAYDKEQLGRTVKHVESKAEGLEKDADIAKTTALLIPGAQWVAYVSPQGVVQWIGVFVEALFGGQIKLPPFPATEPIGLAAKVSESGLDAELVLPAGVVAGIGQYIGVLGQVFQGGPPLP